MATQVIENAPAGDDADASSTSTPSKLGGKRGVLIMAFAGLAAGAAAGLFAVGPALANRRGAVVVKPKAAAMASASVTHAIENLVLNPAGSGGTRFLMVTATFELRDGSIEQQMKDHDAEVRDHILALLGKKTVEELSDITLREAMKQEILIGVSELFPKGSVRKVFFSQFVIQ
jgi:flagellar FliL protein